MTDRIALARHWMADDPDPETRAETEAMLDDPAKLAVFFGDRLEFGTAGLRGPIGPGPGGMNRALVRRVSAGLAAYVKRHAPHGTVVIGYDGRRKSDVFAADTAAVLAGAGLRVVLFDTVCPTPVLAHAVTFLGAAAGVMVTASHNPPQDNGYKVYWANGAQIVPPHDEGISLEIDRVRTLNDVNVPPVDALRAEGRIRSVPPEVGEDYLKRVLALRVHAGAERRARLKIVYTAMHGVGTATLQKVLGAAGYRPILVASQAEPDGEFPTVRFPNPEEPGALDLAIEKARSAKADLIIANDPDADRLAVVVPEGKGWRPLTGNQVGCLLAEDLLANGPSGGDRLVATTIVSSTMLARIAEAHGAAYAECLTGFKWIANAAIPFDQGGGRFVLGYEEALGYSAGDVVRDKDGISAALLFCDLAAKWKNDGKSVLDALDALYRKYGLHASRQVSVKHAGPGGKERIDTIMAGLRSDRIDSIAGAAVLRITDVEAGRTEDLLTGRSTPVPLPKSNVLAWHLNEGSRILARPSGTEPKIKFYFEVVEPLDGSDRLANAEKRAEERLDRLEQGFRRLLRG
ncbi:MAG: phospho-sugar mutase [Alphaproteobacteria bacterium]|nr:phospho-sugar mutase [Alphaproteobacteria bacterium]